MFNIYSFEWNDLLVLGLLLLLFLKGMRHLSFFFLRPFRIPFLFARTALTPLLTLPRIHLPPVTPNTPRHLLLGILPNPPLLQPLGLASLPPLLDQILQSVFHHLHLGHPHRFGHNPQIPHGHLFRNLATFFHLPSSQFFRGVDETHVALRHDAHALPPHPVSRRSTHAMDVIFGVPRHVDVHHQVDVGNVESAGCHVGGDEDGYQVGFEFVEGGGATVLGDHAVQGGGGVVQG
mmetsp:Transcript_8768/g.8893  ORF Transcript_8768/g.8893 Transcript_8768/m.8893 type:complete len:234 (+) Transcript_8768:125-826(+)